LIGRAALGGTSTAIASKCARNVGGMVVNTYRFNNCNPPRQIVVSVVYFTPVPFTHLNVSAIKIIGCDLEWIDIDAGT